MMRNSFSSWSRYSKLSLLLSSSLFLAACGKPGPGAGGPPGGGAAPVSVAPAVARTLQQSDEFSGRLEATESVDIRPRVAGTIDAIHFKDGQVVRKGDLLFTIDPRPYEAELARLQAQLAVVKTQAQLSQVELNRARKLLEIKAISQQEFDQTEAAQANAEDNLKAAEAATQVAALNLSYSRITAPINGRISRTNITVGNLVAVGEPILTSIVSQEKIYAYFDISEQAYFKYVQPAASARQAGNKKAVNPVLLGLANESGFPHKGAIDFVDNRLNNQTGSLRVRAVFDNAQQRYVPGMFARLRLISDASYQAVLTPDRAIGTDQNKKFVFVVDPTGAVQMREVTPGALVDGMRVIESGLQAGELVVVNGLQRVRPGAPVKPEKLDVDVNGMPIELPVGGPKDADPKQSAPSADKKSTQQTAVPPKPAHPSSSSAPKPQTSGVASSNKN